jgi:isobutyryl-CoA mutase
MAVVKRGALQPLKLKHKVRFLTAASLFDGHDAAIHIIRRILVSEGAEVIHLGHDRSVEDIVNAAIQEDVQGIAVSSYQGGHNEYFTYMVDSLRKLGCGHIRVYGGGGGVISPEEILQLHAHGVARIFSPEDGQKLGLEGMIRLMLKECDHPSGKPLLSLPRTFTPDRTSIIARGLSTIEGGEGLRRAIRAKPSPTKLAPIVGITGTGGSGKSSLVDELLIRFLEVFPKIRIAVLCVDPSRRKTGGALLGDRLRVNAASRWDRIFFRSMATRKSNASVSNSVKDSLHFLQLAGFDLVLFETAGIGQSDTEVTEVADTSIYVMTPEFGAPTQLEKIGMLDFSDFVVVNKFDKTGAEDALREVRKAFQRNHKLFHIGVAKMPVFGTCAHRFQDLGTNTLFNALCKHLAGKHHDFPCRLASLPEGLPERQGLLPKDRVAYLRRINETVRKYHQATEFYAHWAGQAEHYYQALVGLEDSSPIKTKKPIKVPPEILALKKAYQEAQAQLPPDLLKEIAGFETLLKAYSDPSLVYSVRDKKIEVKNHTRSLSGLDIPKVTLPDHRGWKEQVRFLRSEQVPGRFPFTAGVFSFKREGEDPTRMFAGEGTAERTNARFHFVSRGQRAIRLSTAFDSVTLYGSDPDLRPDIYGKIGNAGVSVCCLDDAKRLYSGFDLCAPGTSVSMTINGPASIILAFFFNTAIDAACERWLKAKGHWPKVEAKIKQWFKAKGLKQPRYRMAKLPVGHDGSGLGFLGVPASIFMDAREYARISKTVLNVVRGTVQADILKEDQAQNTCIFSTEFSLRLMGDTQQYFIDNGVRNFYSVSISGYHIAEAGANPITQLALTLANGFTYAEYFRARGMAVEKFAPNLSFFFSNGLDPEYAVIGRVARRIWAIAMRDYYQADERSQKLKYHIQTSGRSLHAQDIDFNDIRTTLQALLAVTDNCNSLHTNAYDEAVTTPTEASVRRAIAIQLIINRELGLAKNENPMQGSYFINQLTTLVENAVLQVFEELDARGGVLGAMEVNFQRCRIQEESLLYEQQKQSGELPVVGVNIFINPDHGMGRQKVELIRSTEIEKRSQVEQVKRYNARFPEASQLGLERLKLASSRGGNLFSELLEVSKYCTLGSISKTLFSIGGAYRRNT